MYNRDKKEMLLQAKVKEEMPSGAEKFVWEDVKAIEVAVYKNNDTINTQSVRYNESTHTGITDYKDIQEDKNRLIDSNDIVYEITSANTKARLTTLLLKVVDTNV